MTRETIEKAAKETFTSLDGKTIGHVRFDYIVGFATLQINAALEEAAKACDDGDHPNRFVARIRALKIR